MSSSSLARENESVTPTSDEHGTTDSPSTVSTTTTKSRVAKACLPCSIKKRRCDGGKPECRVCTVLGSKCSYEVRGLKRGPPKGFRSGPRESARAKLLRTLETTVRDLALHIGHSEAGKEIVRVSGERGIEFAGPTNKRIKRERSAPPGTVEGINKDEEDVEDEDVLGINENGAVRHIGSSSGIQLLQQHPSSVNVVPHPAISSTEGRDHARFSSRNVYASQHHHHQPPIQLPSVTSARHHGSPAAHSGPSMLTPSSGVTSSSTSSEERRISVSTSAKLFQHYWIAFHTFWPILYKPALDDIPDDQIPQTLDTPLVNAIYALGACVANPSMDVELEAELGDGPPGEVFAQRAEKFLFHNRTTPAPSFASIQCCFLLACYHQGAGQLSKAYIFSSLANSMAVDLGLHRHLHHYEHDLIERESRSRLIHCIHILSTSLSAEMGRPPMLRSKDIDVPSLGEQEKDEFEVDGEGRQTHTLSLLNHSRRLFAIVETVLTQVHSFRRKAALRRMGTEGIRRVVDEIDGSLEAWRTSLPEWLRLPEDDGEKRDLLPSFAAVQVWYYTAKLLLHRPFIPQDEGLSLTELLDDKYHQKCTQASQRLFDMLYQLASARNVDRLSTDLAYIIFTTAVMFVFNARLGLQANGGEQNNSAQSEQSKRTAVAVQELSTNARRQFLLCKEWLRKLSERWPSASAHKQLLDGFSNVGEGVVTGGEVNQFTGRRPSLVNGTLVPVNAPIGEWTQLPPPTLSPPPSSVQGAPYTSNTYQQVQQSSTSQMAAPQNIVPAQQQVGNGFGSFGMPAVDANVIWPSSGGEAGNANVGSSLGGAVMPQQSLNAYFEFAPNIFDMENVYWNETTTRLTPFLGPRDSTATTTTEAQPVNLSFTPRTFGNISAMANYASIGYHNAPPQLPVATTSTTQQQQQPMAPPSSTPSTMRASRSTNPSTTIVTPPPPRKRTATDSPGLQMLAQQAVVTSASNSATSGGGGGGGASTPNGSSNIGTGGATFVVAPTAGNVSASFSPFSFHQEPSAPEWGDVISMLQLPPAFIQ